MSNTRKIIRAFLASPGDLQEEREAIRDVVAEFNESWANELGYQVELIGWEETVAGFGRPQHLINKDLDRCDLFLGMIWKRWGTPPDHGGEFSSGFEEEYARSMKRCEETGRPEISLFFKQIPEEFMVDPGEDLKKVLEFRNQVTDSKRILFQNFSTTREIETLARKCVTAYVNSARAEDESSGPEVLQAKRARTRTGDAGEAGRGYEWSPLSAEGLEFLEGLVERIREPDSMDDLSASEIARFRLLANSIAKPGNEEMNVGVHDLNLLFAAYTEGMELGRKEKHYLTRLGFQHLASENVPLWCWYATLESSRINPAILSSFVGVDDNEKVGAISVLTALALDIPTDNEVIRRDRLIAAWFSDQSSSEVRTAALEYLAKCGTKDDFAIASTEYGRDDYGTSRSALECMIAILLRTGQVKAAQELVLNSQFKSLNAELLKSVLERFEDVDTSALLLGLEHSNARVRLRAMKVLQSRSALDVGMAERLSGDDNVLVRREAISVLVQLGRPLSKEEVKKILISAPKQRRAGLLGLGVVAGAEKAGEDLFGEYKLDALKRLPEAELEKRVEQSLMYDDAAYFALAEKYFSRRADALRRDVDDRYGAYFDERIRRVEAEFGDNAVARDIVKKMRNLEAYVRKELTRQGLNVLCAAQKPEDLQRIRGNLRDGYAGACKLDAEYLERHGEWTDIPVLANAEGSGLGAALPMSSGNEEFEGGVAKAITSIGKKHAISDLLLIDMPAAILKRVIAQSSESRFASISQDTLLTLFNHKADAVRKAAAVLSVRAFPVKRTKKILREYIVSDNHRYYNVIHWLDLGASMRRSEARKVARAAAI